jgi:nitrogen-specific signal transduction histidine kinase
MNIYSKKQIIKLGLLIFAVVIGVVAILYSNDLVTKLSVQERKKIQLWAETLREIQEIPLNGQVSPTLYKILEDNKTIPVILVDEKDNIITHMNLPEKKSKNKKFLAKALATMKAEHEPIIINFSEGRKNYVYYTDSTLLTKLFYYPFVQISVIALFIFVSYLAFSSSRRAEENQVWVGMSKETAHQLGTPISSLIAWVEMLKMKETDEKLVGEVSKDVNRLETITERFSKIGSTPELTVVDIIQVLEKSVSYIQSRTSSKVEYQMQTSGISEIQIPLNIPLFEWVIENLCKNAIDAMGGIGKLTITVKEKSDKVEIDVTDTGKGIPKSKFKTVFKPGFTTKKRGWGLGLSLAKRIIESYHNGKIFVKNSEPNKNTTFCILLKK